MDKKDKILEVAREVFQEKGKSGARMQEIADKAGVNKALLHYYFTNKEGLFKEVFTEMIRKTLLPLKINLLSGEDLEVKIKKFVAGYIDIMKENPNMVSFILGELRMNKIPIDPPEDIKESLNVLRVQLRDDDRFKTIDPFQIMSMIIGSCIFPFIGRPMLTRLGLEDEQTYEQFLEDRKEILPDIILDGIRNR
ncbi:TetR/AcrR family transcriptional regulator [Flammeovirga sp. SubArs3]|uniref:TetR/AcrR family transcriptional regulator n=1 Tax=Flammeovirga sp. SubArs3 TaxID=2995316 RepID=UPI00248A9669|nr:TetR/AcrR family transcriptional regulator [Flammeovirga sp. SubArs3]